MSQKEMENGDVIITENGQSNLKGWWKRRSKNEKKGIICVGGFLITITTCLAVYFLVFADKTTICKTPECYDAASQIISFIDESSKPCNDFYRFACGTFLRNNSFDDPYAAQSVQIMMQEEIQADINKMLEENIDPDDIALNQAKRFYKACMNEALIEKAGLNQIKVLFTQMGGWPILEGDDWDEENFNWTRAIRNLRAFGGNFDFFFNVTVEVDKEDPDRYILGVHDRFYSPSEISANSKVAFLNYMVEVASQFDVRVENLRKEQNDVLNFVLNLAKISEESKRFNQTYNYHLYSLSDLQREFRTIEWGELLDGVLRHTVELSRSDVINVAEPYYLKKLETLLSRTKKRVIANFMGWHIVQSLINYLPSRILDKAYDYLRKINGQFYRKPRWNVCVEATRDRLSAAINIGYVERYFDDDIKHNVTELIRNVKHQFRKNLLMLDWMDGETKRKIKKALVSSVNKIYSDADYLETIQYISLYDSVQIDEGKLLKAVLDLDLINWDMHYARLRQPVTDEWIKSQIFLSGLKVVYSASDNVLKFPLGLFRGIYYGDNRPDYMNYGLLGNVLAHQIAHVFVRAQGANVAESKVAQQRLMNKWSPESVKKYVDKLECLSKQYSRFEIRDADNIHANTIMTRDEDIADLAGFKIAYDTYLEKEWRYGRDPILPGLKYTSRQLFWISSALQFCSKFPASYLKEKYLGNSYHHSPNEFRVNGPLQNIDQFSSDFGCSHGSYMNPKMKCHVW